MAEALITLLTFTEVCEQLNKTPAQGRWMVHTGDFPKVAKVGGRLMSRQSDVDAYLKAKFADAA